MAIPIRTKSICLVSVMIFLTFFFFSVGTVLGDIPISEAPYLITVDLDNQAVFDGALVAPGWVVVAGTSISWLTDDDWANHITVRAGSDRRSMYGQSLKTKNHTLHPLFSKNEYDYNVAMIQLDGEFPTNQNISVISLGTAEPRAGSLVNVTAFGSLPDEHSSSDDLQQFSVSVISRTACKIAFQDYMDEISDRISCGDMPAPGGVCYGESGAPITQNGALVALYATSLGCDRDGMPALFTNLMQPDILDFVQSTIAVK